MFEQYIRNGPPWMPCFPTPPYHLGNEEQGSEQPSSPGGIWGAGLWAQPQRHIGTSYKPRYWLMWLKFWTLAVLLKCRHAQETWTSQLWCWRHCVIVSKGKPMAKAVLHRSGMEVQGMAVDNIVPGEPLPAFLCPGFLRQTSRPHSGAASPGCSICRHSLCSSCWPEWWGKELSSMSGGLCPFGGSQKVL